MMETQTTDTMISDSEWEVMRIVWTLKQTYANQIIEQLQAKCNWGESTIKTLMRRLVQKGLLKTEKDGRRFIYTAAANQDEVINEAGANFLNKVCDMHKGQMLLQLLKNSPVSQSDLAALQSEIAKKAKTAPETVPCNCLSRGQHSC